MKFTAILFLFVMMFQWVGAQESEKSNKFKPNFTIAGRLMFDYANVDYSKNPEESFSGSEIRRAMLETSGQLSKNIGFKFQIDFAREILNFKEVYIYFDDIPGIGGKFSVGNVLVPFSID